MSIFVAKTTGAGSGMSVAVKDNFDVAGLPSQLGCAAYASAKPAKEHAEVVKHLVNAGFNLKGKLNMHELAFGMTGVNEFAGTPPNPMYPAYITGGSSSGSAAVVAANRVDVSLGTDTGGSIRLPAACCGVFGFKPTFGRVSRVGILPEHSILDCVGPMARSVENIEACMQAIDATFSIQGEPAKVVLGVLSRDVDPLIQSTFESVLDKLVELKGIELKPLKLSGLQAAFEAGMTLIAAEAVAAFGHLPKEKLGADIAARLHSAADINSQQLEDARLVQEKFTDHVSALLEGVDVLVLPTLPHFPLLREQALNGAVDINLSKLVRPFNVSGHPAMTIPIAIPEQLPVGLQIVGAKGADEKVCAIAKRLASKIDLPDFDIDLLGCES